MNAHNYIHVMNSPSLSGNPAVTKVTNAASPRSLHLANASSIRPLWPRCIDSTELILRFVVLLCFRIILFLLLRVVVVAAFGADAPRR